MNERIRELESQCWEPRQYGPAWFDSEKFAELIIMECLTICEELGDKGMDGHYCADKIIKTFRS
jgi:hypothetical protein